MTTNEKVARRKLSLLGELAKELNNVSKACKLIGLRIPAKLNSHSANVNTPDP